MALIYILQVVLGFGFIIFIHEMGHFLAAKYVGIRVHAFSIGFPMPFVGKRFANLFAKKFGDADTQHGYSVAVDGSGNILFTGVVQGGIDFGGGNSITLVGVSAGSLTAADFQL